MMQSFDRFAEDYVRHLEDPLRDAFAGHPDYFIQQKCKVLLRRLAGTRRDRSPLRILDAGCGQGTAMPFMRGAGVVFGSDVSFPMLQDAVKQAPVAVQEPFALPFRDGTFDVAYAFCVYHHIETSEHVRHLRELVRVVAPGGRVFVFEHNPFNPVTQVIFRRAPVDEGCRMIRPAALRATFRGAGLTDVDHGYLLFVPEMLSKVGGFIEPALSWLPLGGQYFVSGRKPLQSHHV